MKYRAFHSTVQGSSHIKHNKECQDSSNSGCIQTLAIASVADGHGDDNCFRSTKGANFAVTYAITGIVEFVKFHERKFNTGFPFMKKTLPERKDFEKSIHDLMKYIIANWQAAVEKDYFDNPFKPEELELTDEKHRKRFENGVDINKAYGTTLIATAITKNYWLAIHIGDGRLTALYPDGSFAQPVPWDENCYLNVTTSLCDDNAVENMRYYFSLHKEERPPVAVFLCTDGIDDNYPVEGNEKHLFKLYRTIATTFAEDGFDSTWKQLKDLASSFALKGKGDDASIAGFIDLDGLKYAVPIWKIQEKNGEDIMDKLKKNEEQIKNNKDNVLKFDPIDLEKINTSGYGNFISKIINRK